MRRPGYREAIRWVVLNDDNQWLADPIDDDAPISVSASLVADLFGVSDERVKEDLLKAIKAHAKEPAQ